MKKVRQIGKSATFMGHLINITSISMTKTCIDGEIHMSPVLSKKYLVAYRVSGLIPDSLLKTWTCVE